MKREVLAIPEYHIECEFCIMIKSAFFCTGFIDEKVFIENPDSKIDLKTCPIWGRIAERERNN